MNENNERLIKVFSSNSIQEILTAKSRLQDSNVKFTTRNDVMQSVVGSNYDVPTGEIEILVLQNETFKAKQILSDLIHVEDTLFISETQTDEFNNFVAFGIISLIILLIFIAVLLSGC